MIEFPLFTKTPEDRGRVTHGLEGLNRGEQASPTLFSPGNGHSRAPAAADQPTNSRSGNDPGEPHGGGLDSVNAGYRTARRGSS